MLNYGEVQVINIYYSWNQIKLATIAMIITIGFNCHWTIAHSWRCGCPLRKRSSSSMHCDQLLTQHIKLRMDMCHSFIFQRLISVIFFMFSQKIWKRFLFGRTVDLDRSRYCICVVAPTLTIQMKFSASDWHVNTIFQHFELTWHELTTNTNCMSGVCVCVCLLRDDDYRRRQNERSNKQLQIHIHLFMCARALDQFCN